MRTRQRHPATPLPLLLCQTWRMAKLSSALHYMWFLNTGEQHHPHDPQPPTKLPHKLRTAAVQPFPRTGNDPRLELTRSRRLVTDGPAPTAWPGPSRLETQQSDARLAARYQRLREVAEAAEAA